MDELGEYDQKILDQFNEHGMYPACTGISTSSDLLHEFAEHAKKHNIPDKYVSLRTLPDLSSIDDLGENSMRLHFKQPWFGPEIPPMETDKLGAAYNYDTLAYTGKYGPYA